MVKHLLVVASCYGLAWLLLKTIDWDDKLQRAQPTPGQIQFLRWVKRSQAFIPDATPHLN